MSRKVRPVHELWRHDICDLGGIIREIYVAVFNSSLTVQWEARLVMIVRRPALAGDQLLIDLDLSLDNLPAGSRLMMGAAVIEVTAQPHSGCHEFMARLGSEALKFVNSPTGNSFSCEA